MNAEQIIGIDLGTTNSEVAILQDGRPLVLSEDGSALLPSVVGLMPDGSVIVGEAARNQAMVAPERTVSSIKRRMGQDIKVSLGDQDLSPQEVSAIILDTLKTRAERHLGSAVRKVVITVPAYFSDAQRQATREACDLAGLEAVRILNEPTAAALAYQSESPERRNVLVYDLGGGTFDVSVVRMEKDVVEVLSSHGDTQLGGDDFDALLVDHTADEFKEAHGIDLRDDPRAKQCLLAAVRKARVTLSSEPFARIDEEFIIEKDNTPLHLSMELERDHYEDLIQPLVNKTLDAVQVALKDADLPVSDIDRILLAGGASRTPLIRRLLRERTGLDVHLHADPDLCVAMGAALRAGLIAGHAVNTVLVDITPHTFGVRCLGEYNGRPHTHCFSPIIPRNTALPVSRTELYYTAVPNQKVVDVEVYQGENRDALQNTRIGRFVVEGLSAAPAENPVTCRLDLDLDGILTVTACEKNTGLQKRISIDNALSRFEAEDMPAAHERIRQLLGSSEEKDAASAPPHEFNEATRALLCRAAALPETVAMEDRAEVEAIVANLRAFETEGRAEDAKRATDELQEILFFLEEA